MPTHNYKGRIISVTPSPGGMYDYDMRFSRTYGKDPTGCVFEYNQYIEKGVEVVVLFEGKKVIITLPTKNIVTLQKGPRTYLYFKNN